MFKFVSKYSAKGEHNNLNFSYGIAHTCAIITCPCKNCGIRHMTPLETNPEINTGMNTKVHVCCMFQYTILIQTSY